ncbi:hypothetical protein V491_00603, partial [Pseudogymnoascus sp. VKM F-3775]
SIFIKNRIAHHQNSSPTSIYIAVDQFTKGALQIMHQLALLKAENQNLQQANEVLSKRRKAKKTRLQQGGSLSQQEAQDLQDERDIVQQVEQEIRASGGCKPREETCVRRCGSIGREGCYTASRAGDKGKWWLQAEGRNLYCNTYI